MFRIALISRWHVHSHKPDERYVKELLDIPECKVSCVYDKDPVIAKEWGEEYGVDYYTDLESVLSREDVDGVLVTSEAKDHKEILISAANHKKHIFTEKVLSFSVEEALQIRDAIKKNNVVFAIAFMRLGAKQLNYAKKLIENGTLGEPVMFRCFCGHNQGITNSLPEYWYDPKVSGGGSMIDLGFNCTYLARYIMGDIESIGSNYSYITNRAVEDNSTCSIKFKNGAIGTLDASFTTPGMSVFEISVYGTKGAYYARFGGSDIAELRLEGKPIEAVKDIPNDILTPIKSWVNACTEGGKCEEYGIDAAVDMVKIMDAAYRSAKNNGCQTNV